METVIAIFVGVAIIAGLFSGKPESDSAVVLLAGNGNSTKLVRHIEPASEKDFTGIVPQEFDFSCSAAALSTMLNYGYGENRSEEDVINGLMKHSDKDEVLATRAFSIEAMKAYTSGLGYNINGYRAEGIDDLKHVRMPCLTPVSIYGYYHFVVVKGLHKGHVFIADPYSGNLTYSEQEFKKIWYGNFVFGAEKNGDNPLNMLAVTLDDLKVIDEDMTRSYLSSFKDRYVLPKEQSVSGKHYYNH